MKADKFSGIQKAYKKLHMELGDRKISRSDYDKKIAKLESNLQSMGINPSLLKNGMFTHQIKQV